MDSLIKIGTHLKEAGTKVSCRKNSPHLFHKISEQTKAFTTLG